MDERTCSRLIIPRESIGLFRPLTSLGVPLSGARLRARRCEMVGGHLDRLYVRAAAPWDHVDPLPVRFLDRETAREELHAARQTGVWVYTDGSVQPNACGAAAIFEDRHGPFGQTRLAITLGPLQSSTDAEMAGIRLALDHLATRTDWHQAYIVSDSQAALLQLGGISWRQTRASIWDIHCRAWALRRAGHLHGLVVGPGPCRH